MDKIIIFKILYLLALILGLISMIISIVKPVKLIRLNEVKLNRKTYFIKDKEGFARYKQKFYQVFGIICIMIAMLSLNKTIDITMFSFSLIILNVVSVLVNSTSIKKYI